MNHAYIYIYRHIGHTGHMHRKDLDGHTAFIFVSHATYHDDQCRKRKKQKKKEKK